MPGIPGGWELVLILLVVMVLFGAKRLPDSARSLGRSMRILKAETKGMREDDDRAGSVRTTSAATNAAMDDVPSPTPLPGTPPPPGYTAAPTGYTTAPQPERVERPGL